MSDRISVHLPNYDEAAAIRLYDQCVADGRALQRNVESARWSDEDDDSFPSFRSDYEMEDGVQQFTPDSDGKYELLQRFTNFALDPERLVTKEILSKGEDKYTAQNATDTESGIIVCLHNDNTRDMTPQPDRLPNWELIYQTWGDACGGRRLHRLRYVWRNHIANPATLTVLKRVWPAELGRMQFVLFDESEEQFLAILGTPNGRGQGYMLQRHCLALGRKQLQHVQIFKDRNGDYCIGFALEEDPRGTDLQRRPHKKSAGKLKREAAKEARRTASETTPHTPLRGSESSY